LNRLLAEGKLRRHRTCAPRTEALGEEVEVDLVQAIGRGDECRESLVHPRPRRSQVR
jgi:hypothetical protein